MAPETRVGVVVLTHNRPTELQRALQRLVDLPERPPIVVVDNASRRGTVDAVLREFAQVESVRCEQNRGAAGRNAGVALLRTPYVAFCDDDTWWAPGSLSRAADLLDAHPSVAALSARVLVGEAQREDPTCERMARSPLDSAGLPGPALIGFMAGATVMRCAAFRAVGGYEPRLFLGAEEWLMALDFAARGWHMVYAREVVTHHHPSSTARDPAARRLAVIRNKIWIAWMRLPPASACQESRRVLREAARTGLLMRALGQSLAGLPWALRRRAVVPRRVTAMVEQVAGAYAKG
ncbi:MAG TPA: glycosyltransferase [Albitalea sp.]|nr:glycosyltransferase [Albitalea sp.]